MTQMKYVLAGLLTVLLLGSFLPARGLADELAGFELSLFGYRFGMTFDQATMVRPFTRIEEGREGPMVSCGYVDQLWVDDMEARLKVCFTDDRLYKVVGRLPSALAEEVVGRLQRVFGRGDNESKLYQTVGGAQVNTRVQKWFFPELQVVLIGTSNNPEFVTLSLLPKSSARSAGHPTKTGD